MSRNPWAKKERLKQRSRCGNRGKHGDEDIRAHNHVVCTEGRGSAFKETALRLKQTVVDMDEEKHGAMDIKDEAWDRDRRRSGRQAEDCAS